jgi:hypothetical protein
VARKPLSCGLVHGTTPTIVISRNLSIVHDSYPLWEFLWEYTTSPIAMISFFFFVYGPILRLECLEDENRTEYTSGRFRLDRPHKKAVWGPYGNYSSVRISDCLHTVLYV